MARDDTTLHYIYREVAFEIYDQMGVKIALKGTDGQIDFTAVGGRKRCADAETEADRAAAKSQREAGA